MHMHACRNLRTKYLDFAEVGRSNLLFLFSFRLGVCFPNASAEYSGGDEESGDGGQNIKEHCVTQRVENPSAAEGKTKPE